jgi:tRNA dimethylallyltransferase
MQIYKGMDIISSKPEPSFRKKVPHHLIDIVSAQSDYDVSRYRKAALNKIREVLKRGKVPLFVGGTGLYISVLVDGIFKDAGHNPQLRSRLYRKADKFGSGYLHKKLAKVDPAAAQKIHPNDTRRIIRALEVYALTGKPISKLQRERQGLTKDFEVRIFCLNMPRDKLYARINARVDAMFGAGLEQEVRRLLKKRLSRTASCAIGLKELKGYFAAEYDFAEALRLIKRNSRAYAKRQLTWFRKDPRIQWVNISAKEKPQNIANRIWKKLS